MMNAIKRTIIVSLFILLAFGSSHGSSIGNIVSVVGEVKISQTGKVWEKARRGGEISDFLAIKVRDQSYLRILLADNSLLHVGEDTFFSLAKRNQRITINIGRGRLRILSYKDEKVIKTPQREFSLYKGEYLIDVNQKDKIIRTNLTAYSGHLFYNGEVVLPERYFVRPEKLHRGLFTTNEPYSYYFPPVEPGINYDIAINIPRPKKSAERGPASVEREETPFNENIEIEKEEGQIWVHDIVFDETVRIVENLIHKEIKKIAQVALKEASSELVWDVAGKSIKRWGVYFAKQSKGSQVPLAVKNAYESQLRDDSDEDISSFHYYDSYESSTVKVAEMRTYRVAKVLVETKAYERAWRETRAYIMELMPKVVTPLVVKELYEKVRPLVKEPVMKVIKESGLVYTKDVDRLINHITYLSAKSFTQNIIKTAGKKIATDDAKKVVSSLSQGVSHDIATYMATQAGERAKSLVSTLFARKRARSIASEVADETNEKIYQKVRKRQRRRLFESIR